MGLEKFDVNLLSTIDGGRLKVALEQAIRRVTEDCKERPADDRARKVTLAITLKPIPDAQGNLDEVTVSFDIGEAIPKRSTRKYSMAPVGRGLVFNEMSPDAVKQMTIDETGPRKVRDAGDDEAPGDRKTAASR